MKRFLLILYSIFVTVQVWAQQKYQRLTVEDGLSNNIVTGVVQDSKNFMWFATLSGINRYDGKTFVPYKLPAEDAKNPINFEQTINIVKDKNGNLWTSTRSLLYKYNSPLNKFEIVLRYKAGNGDDAKAYALFADNNNQIWIGTSYGLMKYNINTQKLIFMNNTKETFWAINQDKKGAIWAASPQGIIKYTTTTNHSYRASHLKLPASIEPISIYTDENSNLWIGSLEQGLFIFNIKTQKLKNTSAINKLINNSALRSIVYLPKKKQYLLGIDGEGLIRLSENLDILVHETYNPDRQSGISSNSILQIYGDSFDRVWITTYGGGVSCTSEKFPFKSFSHEINNYNSLYNNMGRSCVEDDEGNLWFGTSKGISIYYPKTEQWRHLSLSDGSRSSGGIIVLALLNSKDGHIWAGTYGSGLKKINTKSLKVEHYKADSASGQQISLTTNYIFTLYMDSRKNIWVGGIRGLLFVLNQHLPTISSYDVRDTHTIIEDKDGNILAGGTNGLYFINIYTNASSKLKLGDAYQNIQVYTMLKNDDGNIWIGTRSGLLLYNQKKGIIKYFLEKDGLSSDIILGLAKDNQNRLWISTANGLSSLDLSSNRFQNYYRTDGLGTSQFNDGSYYKTKSGNIIFGGTAGFVMFNPAEIKQQYYPAKIVFTDFKIGNQSVTANALNSPLQKQIDDVSEIRLKHNQNSISFDFVNTSPQSVDKKTYSWILEGFDKVWSNPSSSTSANYTNLYPGTYIFKVRAFNSATLKNDIEKSIKVYIASPFYRTWWAYLLYTVLLVMLFIGLKFYIKTLLARKRDKERLQFFVNIAHDLRTPLTLIKSPINSILHKTDLSTEDKKNLDIAERNTDRLMRLVTQLLDFQKADANKMKIRAGYYNIVAVLGDILTAFKPLFEEKKINLKYQPNTEKILVWLDRDKFEKIIYNLVSNAIKYSKEQGVVTVDLYSDDNYCHISIADNGIGIPEKQQKQIFQSYYRADNAINLQETGSGIGLMLTKQLVELHRGNIEFSSKINFGTTFKLSFLLSDHFSAKEKLEEEPAADLEEMNGKKSRKGTQLLIAEDNLELQSYLVKELSKFYNVDAAINGKESLKLVKQHSYDLIVSDIMMPEMNGYQLCTFLKNQISTCHIPVILLTAIHDEEYRIEGYTVGADDYVQKPFNVMHLKTRIDNLLLNREIIKNKFFNTFDKQAPNPEEDPNFIFISKATQIVTDNLQNSQFSIDTLCNELAMSRSVLFRRLKDISDTAPQDFIKNIRLKIAAEMLMSKKYSINEIAFMTGFSDAKYFSTSFKKKFKQSPTEYLKELQVKMDEV